PKPWLGVIESMNRTLTFTAVALAAAMLVPTGLASWGSYGGQEPDNKYDLPAAGNFVWQGPPTGTDQVYFNVVNGYAPNGPAGASPNSATLGDRVQVAGTGSYAAILGVWVDCNKDGYVGLADGALREYRADVSAAAGFPVDTDRCPVVPEDAAHAGAIHNANNWITELIPITNVTIANTNDDPHGVTDPTGTSGGVHNPMVDYRVIVDESAKMWADRLQPVTPTAAPARDGCTQATVMFGKGQTRHTGGILDHIDCVESLFAPRPNTVFRLVSEKDPTGAVGPAVSGNPVAPFSKPSDLWDGGVLDVDLFGTDQSCAGGEPQPCSSGSNSIVSGEQDCSSAPVVDTTDETGTPGQSGQSGVRAPGQPNVNQHGTVAATVNETHEESALDDCNSADDGGLDFYGNGVTEVPVEDAVTVTGKNSAEMNFFWDGGAGRVDCEQDDAVALCQLNGMPLDAGAPATEMANTNGLGATAGAPQADTGSPGNEWLADAYYADELPLVNGNRVNTDDPTRSTVGFFPGDFYTFYASVGLSGLVTPGGVGQYGAPWCLDGIGRNAGIQNGWDCDPANWNLDPTTGAKLDDQAHRGTV